MRKAAAGPNWRAHLLVALVLVVWLGNDWSHLRAEDSSPAAVHGRELAQQLCREAPGADLDATGVFHVDRGDAGSYDVPVSMHVVLGDLGWCTIYQAHDPRRKEIIKLTIIDTFGLPPQYLLECQKPGQTSPQPSRKLTGEESMTPFAHTDFWLADLGRQFFYWPQQRLLRYEMRRGRSCRVLESIDPHPAPGGYARVLSWIDYETHGIVQAEAYDAKGNLIKKFKPIEFAKVNGRWEVKKLEIQDRKKGSTTRLEFNLKEK